MQRIGFALALAALFAAGGAARASDPVGGYLIVDKVVLEPSDAPTKAQIWGTVVLATKRGGYEWGAPQRGYFYYEAPKGKEAVCRREWNDLKKAAGTRLVIGFGTSRDLKAQGTVRKGSEKPKKPDAYPVGNGLVKMDDERDYQPVRDLLSTPSPRSPAEGDLVPPGAVTFETDEIADPKRSGVAYAFELAGENGDKERGAAEPCKGGVKWSPSMKLKPGVKYTWTVRATKDRWQGPAVSVAFAVKDEK
jgi:hypothetical protein